MRRMYFTNSGLTLTADGSDLPSGGVPIAVAEGGTGASDAAGARANLGVSASGADTAYAWRANNLSDLTNATTARGNLGIGNVENKSSATIRSEITSSNVTTALGYTPLNPANNLSDIANAATARSNLGVAASGADTNYAWRTNNLSDLTNAGTARTNLGLGTAAVANTGTSGHTLPFLDGANTYSGTSTIFNVGALTLNTTAATPITFSINNATRGQLTANGYLKVSNINTYYAAASDLHEFATDKAASPMAAFSQFSTNPQGVISQFASAAPNDAAHYFLACFDTGGNRFIAWSNGGLHNYQANNANLSDAELKTDIARYTPAQLDALEAAFTAVDWGTFKYIDQTHADPNHGYTAQGVEAAFANVAPELVDDTDLGPQSEAGAPKHKAVYDTDLTHIGLALLARALVRIEALERLASRPA